MFICIFPTNHTYKLQLYLEPRWICAGVAALLAAVRLLPGVDADVPGDLLLVPGRVLAVGAFVQTLGSM